MNSPRARRARLALATALASVLWGGFVAQSGWLWKPSPAPRPQRQTVEMKFVELPAPAPAPTGGEPARPGSSAPPSVSPASTREAPRPPRPRVRETAPPSPPERATQPAPAAPRETPAAPAPPPDANAVAADGADPAPTAGSSDAGSAPARLLSRPLPDLPDDLREAAYRATAVARFTVHADGGADVELIRPTSLPRLNRILLDALRRWRFAPATADGRPVESRQDVRVHFNVE